MPNKVALINKAIALKNQASDMRRKLQKTEYWQKVDADELLQEKAKIVKSANNSYKFIWTWR